jgi:hypothetical protein
MIFGFSHPAFPRLGVERLLLADLQKRIARERIHRLQTAVINDRQFAKFVEREILVGRRLQLPKNHSAMISIKAAETIFEKSFSFLFPF